MAGGDRATEVYATLSGVPRATRRDADWSCGSGLLIAGGLVLTSAHVVSGRDLTRPDPGGAEGRSVDVSVRVSGRLWKAEVVWLREDALVDAALVRIVESEFREPAGLTALRWGRLVCDRPGAEVESVGFPQVRVRPNRVRDTEQLLGQVQPLGLAKARKIDIAVTSAPKSGPSSKRTPWAGMSGAGVFCNDVLVGVIERDESGYDSRRLSAVPVATLLDDPEFVAQLGPGPGPGLDPAELEELQVTTVPPVSAAALLRADAEVVDFRGREDILGRLTEWCERPDLISAFLVTGSAGQGKTRLAQHFAKQMSRAGWARVILGTSGVDGSEWLRSVGTDLLLVVDYAEHRLKQLERLAPLLSNRGSGKRLRVLLLARSDGEWRRPEHAAWDFLATAGAERLRPLDPNVAAVRDTFAAAVSAFATRLSTFPGYREIPWDVLARNVTAPSFPADPAALEVQMPALARLLEGSAPVSAARPGDSVEKILNLHEERYWTGIAGQRGLRLPASIARAAVVAAGLVPVVGEASALAVLGRVPGLAGYPLTEVDAWLRASYPDAKPRWGYPQPDLLLEHLVGAVTKDSTAFLPALLADVDPAQGDQALTLLTRAAIHQPHLPAQLTDVVTAFPATLAQSAIRVAVRSAEPEPLLTALDQIVEEAGDDLDFLAGLHRAIAPTTQLHAALAVRVAERLVVLIRKKRASGSARWRLTNRRDSAREAANELARALNNFALRLRQASRHAEALAAIEEAVAIRRRLAAHRPGQYQRDYAASLSDLSYCLAELGRHDDALNAITEAVRIRRTLSDDAAELARALNNRSNCLANLGRHKEGLAAIEETVAILGTIPDADADLARSWNNLSVTLGYLGLGAKGLDSIDRAVTTFRRLSHERPDEFRPELAAALDNRAIRLLEMGSAEEALVESSEATSIYRDLVERSEACRPGLAASLTNRSSCLAELGQAEHALLDIQGAVKVYRALAAQRPDAFHGHLRKALNSLSDRLRDVGRNKEADEIDDDFR